MELFDRLLATTRIPLSIRHGPRDTDNMGTRCDLPASVVIFENNLLCLFLSLGDTSATGFAGGIHRYPWVDTVPHLRQMGCLAAGLQGVRTCWDRFCEAAVNDQLLQWSRQVLSPARLYHLFRSLSGMPWLASDVIVNSGRVACCRFWNVAAAALLHDVLFRKVKGWIMFVSRRRACGVVSDSLSRSVTLMGDHERISDCSEFD